MPHPAHRSFDLLSPRWRPNLLLCITGAAAVVAGGIVAAVTGPASWARGSWVAAFLVLVAGVAQVCMGAGQALLAPAPVRAPVVRAEWALWNVGCAAVVGASLSGTPALVTMAGVSLVAAMVATLWVTRGAGSSPAAVAYRLVVAIVVAGVPVGIALSWIRH